MLRRIGTSLSAAILLGQVSAFAWEIDVHYLLTWWLATQAGFSRGDADAIARADQSFDDSDHHAAIPTVLWIVLSQDIGAARDLQKKHFPSDAQLPSPPQRRVVAPNSAAARAMVEAAIRPNPGANALQDFGEGLHPFQDSWSHQGVPDVPFRPLALLSPNLSCAHPERRGGWTSHNADLTYLHEADAIEMARQTYTLLLAFLDKNPHNRVSPSAPWGKLVPVVRDHAIARTKAEKDDWAVKYVPASPDPHPGGGRAPATAPSNSSTTLSGARGRGIARPIRPPMEQSAAEKVPPALVERANAFVQLWMTKQDLNQAVTEYVDPERLKQQLVGFSKTAEWASWTRKVLTMYLAADHAAVNAAGHGDPSNAGYRELPELPATEGRFKALREIPVTPITAQDFILVKAELSGPFALAIRPGGLRHDAVCFVWNMTKGEWRIAGILPIVD